MNCEHYLKKQLEDNQFISVYQFMELALYHPKFGYYMKQNPLGDKADFVTSPEVSQLFGEVLCLWAMKKYMALQKPRRLAVIELGPGRGLLMSDFLRFAQRYPEFHASLDIHFVEISPTLQSIQQTKVTSAPLFWHQTIEDAFEKIQEIPVLILANEFFDALPVEQYRQQDHVWQQRCLQLNNCQELDFCFRNMDHHLIPLNIKFDIWQNDQIIEHHVLTENIMQKIVDHFKMVSGAAAIVDYGYLKGQGDTLQGVSQHQYVNVLKNPGAVDLSTHINFKRLQNIAGSSSTIMTQRDFLFKHGILELTRTYGRDADTLMRTNLEQQIYKLTSSQEMGTLFKVLEINSFPLEEPNHA